MTNDPKAPSDGGGGPDSTRGLRRFSTPVVRPIVSLLAHTPITPNAITVSGLFVTAAAAYAVAIGQLALGGGVLLFGSAMDAFDGALARATGRASKFGAYLDSVIDRMQESLLFLGLVIYYFDKDHELGVILSVLAMTGSYLVSYSRARAEGLGYRGETGFMPRPVRILVLGVALIVGQPLPALGIVAALSGLTTLQRGILVWRQAKR